MIGSSTDNKDIVIREIEPAANTLVQQALSDTNYCDAHEVKVTPGRFENINALSREFFLAQPVWLLAISMGLFSRERLESIVKTIGFKPREKVGSWKIYDHDENEIVFGESLGFMTYRFSLRLRQEVGADTIIASTVAIVNGVFRKMYFSLVLLLHKRFIRLMLRNTLRL